ncbi:hypothetical protein H5V45_19970 [Nocardioides sp. KIGAM211]|uniref:Uncharacterized protein n=1 Tax=Nocardioides luti TaxID=2761101 RepID=A0A7X0VCC9_9ACTN|nr:hypothetical protein [Nocardioides luti]MBB6629606.1 hypothetical protein [Nocardioides luti]
MRLGRWVLVVGTALLLVVLAGVWGFGLAGRDRSGTPAVATVDGPMITLARELEVYPTAGVRGVLLDTDGCLTIAGSPVVFVYGSVWDPSGRGSVTFPAGDGVAVGKRVDGGGGFFDVDAGLGGLEGDGLAAARTCVERLGGLGVVLYWQ